MSLRPYCRTRLVVMNSDVTVLEAARALESNRIGTIIIQDKGEVTGIVTDRDIAIRTIGRSLDPETTQLKDIMSTAVATLKVTSAKSEAIEIMQKRGVRRIPIQDNGRVAGIVTLDDLLLDEAIPLEVASSIIRRQIEEGGPTSPTRHALRQARAESTYRRLVNEFHERSQLATTDAEKVLLAGLGGIVRRLTPGEAKDLISQLPMRLHEPLYSLPEGPDRAVTKEALKTEISRLLDVDADRADEILSLIGAILEERVTPGQIEDVIGQLPEDLRQIFPSQIAREIRTGA